jgi:hypothetical protein
MGPVLRDSKTVCTLKNYPPLILSKIMKIGCCFYKIQFSKFEKILLKTERFSKKLRACLNLRSALDVVFIITFLPFFLA